MITVFTSCYNHAEYLPAAIDSVLAQTHKDFEYILIDDGSTDNSLDIMRHYASKDDRIRVIPMKKQKNKGPVINKSINEMKGTHWTWMPADDLWGSKLLERKLEFSKSLPENAIVYHDYFLINAQSAVIGDSDLKELTPETFKEEVWISSPIGFTGIWIPASVLREIPFPNHIKYSEDFYWMIKAAIHNIPFYHLKEQLHCKRKHGTSVTDKNLQAILKNVPMIRAELELYRDNYYYKD